MVFGTTEAFIKWRGVVIHYFWIHDVEPQEPLPDNQAVFNGRKQLFVDIFSNNKFINDNFHIVGFALVQFDIFADVVQLAINQHPPISFGAYIVKKIGVIFTVDFEDWRVEFNFRLFWQR